ncbi:unnamed protein product [Adineta ricciae]|uniref:G-protein coupled receptors family 1 profile domain-containing protein n=1 Tax=Adineta ricciae TaxID=249248 RepID=A0A815UWX7_ADIRI|nr:unnamed protein product [Adineta ricciae]
MDITNTTIELNSTLHSNFLVLSRVRLVVKFYLWPLLVVFGLIGNSLSILVLTRRRLIRTSTNNYLTILAVFDSCYLIFTLILNFGSHPSFTESVLVQNILYILRPLADFSSNTATWLIVCFTLERTLAVAKPIYAKRTCSVRRSRHLICTLLIICFLISTPTYFEGTFTREINACDGLNSTQRTRSIKQQELLLTIHRLYLIFICIVIIWIPLVLLCICNSILIWYVHRSRRFDVDAHSKPVDDTYSMPTSPVKTNFCPSNYQSCSSNMPLKSSYAANLRRHSRSYIRKRKVTIVLICCLFVALLLWTPQSLSLTYETLIESYSDMSPKRRMTLLIFNNFANLFLCINASIDFILYCFLSEKFARTCQQIIWRKCSTQKLIKTRQSRLRGVDRGSFILSNTSNNSHQQQQQLAADTTNNYYAQLYNFCRQTSINRKNKVWKKKMIQSLTTTTNSKDNNRVYYRTVLLENKKNSLNVTQQCHQKRMVNFQNSIDVFSNTDDDYVNNELNTSVNTSISSNK